MPLNWSERASASLIYRTWLRGPVNHSTRNHDDSQRAKDFLCRRRHCFVLCATETKEGKEGNDMSGGNYKCHRPLINGFLFLGEKRNLNLVSCLPETEQISQTSHWPARETLASKRRHMECSRRRKSCKMSSIHHLDGQDRQTECRNGWCWFTTRKRKAKEASYVIKYEYVASHGLHQSYMFSHNYFAPALFLRIYFCMIG